MPTRSHWFKLRLSPRELDVWKEAADLAGTTLSEYVRDAVNARIRLDRTLREQAARDREAARRQRIAAQKLAEAEERRRRGPTRDEMIRTIHSQLRALKDELGS